MPYVIEKNVPMPAKQSRTGELSSALNAMEVGDSICVRTKTRPNTYRVAMATKRKFSSSGGPGEWRVWRIA